MSCQTEWVIRSRASAYYAAYLLDHGRSLADPTVIRTLTPAACEISSGLRQIPLAGADFWLPLLAEVAQGNDDELEWCQSLMAGHAQSTPWLELPLANALNRLRRSFAELRPSTEQELLARMGPIRLQWEARGPGLLRGVGLAFELGPQVATTRILLVQPWTGGGSAVLGNSSALLLEAVLTDVIPGLPEVLRLAWSICQANFGILLKGHRPAERQRWLLAMALLPAVLQASEDVELARLDGDHLTRAIQAWHVLPSPCTQLNSPVALSERLLDWWRTFSPTTRQTPQSWQRLGELLEA